MDINNTIIELLTSYVESLRPIIYINHFDFYEIDSAISSINNKANIIEFNNGFGVINFKTKSPYNMNIGLEEFLRLVYDEGNSRETFLILKDIHSDLNNPKIISLLRSICEYNLYKENYYETIFIVSDVLVIPKELENYITVFDIPLPSETEIMNIIHSFISDLGIKVEDDVVDMLAISFKGMNSFQIRQILNLAYHNGGKIDKNDSILVIKEKKQFLKKSTLLEIVDFSETMNDIGGLKKLKGWLTRKRYIIKNLDKAIKFGVDIPRGILIVGIPGCGKSLTAKATASLFDIPLVKLDISRLLGKYVGESEINMRRALKLSEAISPCVLWVDEIEKAFSGMGTDDGSNGVTRRLFGQFLTWMQEKDSTVFIVATANDISSIPPELLRKGRFDEIFSVDFPEAEERKSILEIHLKKRNKWEKNINIDTLVNKTEGYCGADLEAVVKDAIETAFIYNKEVTTDSLLISINKTKSLSALLGEDNLNKIKEQITTLKAVSAS